MTNKIDEYNQMIIKKKEQVNELLNEKKQLNIWLDDYHDFTSSTTGLYRHLAERYYESDMFNRIEENNDMFHSGQRQVMNELYEQQNEIDRKIRLTNEDIEDIDELNKQISQLEAMNESLKHKPSKNNLLLSGNNQMISSLEQQKKELEEKLRKLRQFNEKSPNIFKEVESFQKNVQQGINQAKTAWDPGKQVFHIPSGKNMEWAKVSQQKALEVRMNKINQKTKDGKKLSKNDLQIVMGYAQSHPKEDVPKNLKEYMIQNKDSITRDLGLDITTNGVEQVGFNMQKFAGVLNTYGGFKGPNGKNSFVQVTNKSGNQMIKHGRLVSNIGKVGGYTTMGVGFGLGMYDDLANNNSTIGEATAHNGLTTGLGVGISVIVTSALSSNPIGWAILGGIAAGTLISAGVDLAYQTNWLGTRDKVDWAGHQLDKGIDKYIDFKTKQITLEAKGALYMKNKLQDSSQEIVEGVENGANYFSNKAKKVEKNVGEAINNVKKVANPMKWSW